MDNLSNQRSIRNGGKSIKRVMNVHFVIKSVRIELDLRPPDSHRYPDRWAKAVCKQLTDDIAKVMNAGEIDVQFKLSEHGFPRMDDNTPTH